MKRFIPVTVLVFLLLPAFGQCDTSLWKYVYHPDRFVVKKKCKTVTGIIYSYRSEADGDYHIKLKPDKGQGRLLNKRNYEAQDTCLVVEVICVKKPVQTDAINPCTGCPNNIAIPKKGQHIKVTGTYVLDRQKIPPHGWMEIHPASSIEVIK